MSENQDMNVNVETIMKIIRSEIELEKNDEKKTDSPKAWRRL